MKKFTMCFAGAMMILSLAACTPTPVKQAATQTIPDELVSTGGASDKVPDPNVEPMEIVSIYSIDENSAGLTQAMDAVDDMTAQAVVDKMIEYGVLEDGTKVLKFDTEDAKATLDLDKVPVMEGQAEKLMLTSIGNTFTENFGLEEVKLLVNGKNYSGGSVKQSDNDTLSYNKDYKNMK